MFDALKLANPLEYLENRERWFLNCDRETFQDIIDRFLSSLKTAQKPGNVLVAELNPVYFLAAILAAFSEDWPLFLGNYTWGQQEWQQALGLIQPDLIWSQLNFPDYGKTAIKYPALPQQAIMIPTGGTSGKIKFAIHTWQTLQASVVGLYRYFDQQPLNFISVLPVYHVSGLMPFIRALMTDGKFLMWSYHELKQGKFPDFDLSSFFLSLVPTQLQFLLDYYPQELRRFKAILIGGAPPWPSLLEKARKHDLPLALTYGMTETASQVVTLKPEDFLAGNNSNGRVLSHASLSILGRDQNQLAAGIIKIKGDSLCWGYYPEIDCRRELITDDLGYFDERGYLYILGRNSQKIITGGENVFPAEIEGAILAIQKVRDVCVVGIEDERWGQVVTAVYVPKTVDFSLEKVKEKLRDRIATYKQPKQWIAVPELPRNAQGKINRTEVQKIALSRLYNHYN
ncbi:MAG: 2-succinylbenzoate--CoA ligase [Spirulinaceae cyanobacterium]